MGVVILCVLCSRNFAAEQFEDLGFSTNPLVMLCRIMTCCQDPNLRGLDNTLLPPFSNCSTNLFAFLVPHADHE